MVSHVQDDGDDNEDVVDDEEDDEEEDDYGDEDDDEEVYDEEEDSEEDEDGEEQKKAAKSMLKDFYHVSIECSQLVSTARPTRRLTTLEANYDDEDAEGADAGEDGDAGGEEFVPADAADDEAGGEGVKRKAEDGAGDEAEAKKVKA